MERNSKVIDLLLEYESLCRIGATPTPEELCREHPHFLPEVRQGIARLQAGQRVFDVPGGLDTPPAPPSSEGTTESWATTPAGAGPGASAGAAGAPLVPGYEVLGELGRGGMGVVYKARHLRLNRLVALKMILVGEHAGPEHRLRFLAEAEAVAALSHPGIVQVYEFGTHNGLPFFALELCPRGSLADRLDGTPQPSQKAAQLAEQLARAVQVAHEKGIIHRDLKPANVLLVEDDAPKVTDFGLAKRVEGDGGLTQTGAQLGTPSYMAPEQAEPRRGPITFATDVYGVGAILYECLTGRPPFNAETAWDTMVQVLCDEPVPVRRLQPKVSKDLETICLKCLHKEPLRRYASAADLAADLGRFRAGEPIRARPVGLPERAVKWARRRPAPAALLAVVLLATLVLIGGGAWFTVKLDQKATAEAVARENLAGALVELGAQKKEADDASAKAQRQAELLVEQQKETKKHLNWGEGLLHVNRITLADREAEMGNHSRANEVLEKCSAGRRGWEWHYLRQRTRCGLPLKNLMGHRDAGKSGGYSVYSPDGSRLASASSDKTVRVWDASSRDSLLTLKGHTDDVNGVAYSPDGSRLASASSDGTVRVWDASSGASLPTLKGHTDDVNGVAYSPDGSRLASASSDGTVRVWDARSGAILLTLKVDAGTVKSVAYSPDGSQLASASQDGTVRVWDARRGAILFTLKGHTDKVNGVAYSPDGSRLASCNFDKTVRVWDARGGAGLLVLKGHAGAVHSVTYAPDGSRLASASSDGTVRVWDARGGTSTSLLILKGHTDRAHGVAYSPDGSRLASASWDGTVKVWDARSGADLLTLEGHFRHVYGVAYSPDGSCLASASRDGTVRVWDARSGAFRLTLEGHTSPVDRVAYSPDRKRIVAQSAPRRNGKKSELVCWDASTGARIVPCVDAPPKPGQRLAPSPGGQASAWISGRFVFARSLKADSAAARARRQAQDDLDTLLWRRHHIAAADAADWYAALFHHDYLRHSQPEADLPHKHRSAVLTRAVRLTPKDVQAQLALARVCIAEGDAAGYGEHCAAARAQSGTDLGLARQVAWACVLAPDALRELKPLLEAAENDAADGKDHQSLRTLGGLLLRTGQHADAVQRLDQARSVRDAHATPAEELLLAIALHHRGRHDEARRWLARANFWLDAPREAGRAGRSLAALPAGPLRAVPGLLAERPDPRELLFGWQAWLDLQVLRCEAKALLAADRR